MQRARRRGHCPSCCPSHPARAARIWPRPLTIFGCESFCCKRLCTDQRPPPAARPSSTMPDAFFVSSKTRKRKRTTTRPEGANKRATINGKGRPTGTKAPSQPAKKRRDEDLESDATQDDDLGGIDDMDLRGSDVDPGASGEEDETETPAEKRLRLAKLYLEEIKEGIGEFCLRKSGRPYG